MATVDITQEQAVLSAIAQVCAMTGFGRVVIEIKDSQVRLIEISATVLIKRGEEVENAKENPA